MTPKDITHLVSFQNNDDESLPITRCACGLKFAPWEFTVSVYSDDPTPCPSCGRTMFFSAKITVYEVDPPTPD